LASTSEVYGDPQVHPQTEEYWGNVNPCGLRSCYDEGKRVAETLTMVK
jgi:UDP-glucuronate decarboxylase